MSRAGGDAPVTLTALQGRQFTLDDLLTELETPSPAKYSGGHNDADTDIDAGHRGGTSRISRASAMTREGSRASGRSGIRARADVGIREVATRAARVVEEPGTIMFDTGTAARVAAATEAVSRAAERSARRERERRASTSPYSEGARQSASVGTFFSPRSEATPRSSVPTPRSLHSVSSAGTPRTPRAPRSIDLLANSPRSHARSVQSSRPHYKLAPRSWLTAEQRSLLAA